jgi:hypothetical protein
MSAPFPSSKVRSAQPRRADPSATRASGVRNVSNAGEAYRLSRIQAEGWNVAHGIAASALGKLDGTQIELLNPYKSDPERMRWSTGFRSALRY